MNNTKNVALVKTYFDMTEGKKGIDTNQKKIRRQSQSYPPLGLCYLASYLNSKNIKNIEIIDCVERKYSIKKCAEYLIEGEFDIIGFTVSSFVLKGVYGLIKEVRKEKKNVLIVLGGVHLTYYPETVKLLGADYGFRGDAEESFYQLLTNFNYHIDGLIYIENGEIKYNKPATIENLDDLPFPVVLKHHYKFPFTTSKIYTVITSRGCLYNCSFCALPHMKEFRVRSPENVFSELKGLSKEGIKYIDFKDDCFTSNRSRVVSLCNLIIDKNLRISWGMATRADLLDFELLEIMKKAGCHNVRMGIESGVERIRKEVIGKVIKNDVFFDVSEMCRTLKIVTVGYFLFGNPTETLEDMKNTITFIKKLNLDYIDVLLAVPIPNSRLFNIAVAEGQIPEGIWNKAMEDDFTVPRYVPAGLTIEIMRKMQRKAYIEFYFRPQRLLRELVDIKKPADLISRLRVAGEILFNY